MKICQYVLLLLLSFAGSLLLAHSADAYIGPGAGFAVVSSFLILPHRGQFQREVTGRPQELQRSRSDGQLIFFSAL